ncbi:unnamed protein product [Angiostrongylus costaricensis]|uniref:Tyrosine-protein kinase n=1 Tax=Angiostrongylus costaricensis TaxID=334426 RepID=A0A0R3PSI9_ANGCS|nr:unnamed protein product [Angiostrongylus costaricensis]
MKFLLEVQELEKEEWYHGMIPVEDAKSILHQNGDFLVRKIERERKFTPPVLTVFWDTILYHFPLYDVKRNGGAMQFTVNTFHQDSSYSKVIKLHLSEKLPIFGEIILKNGAPKQLTPLVKTSFCYDIAAGLAYLHSNNCMHRDVAARNCLVTSDNRMVKLSDFGLAAHGRRAKLTQFDKVPIRWLVSNMFGYQSSRQAPEVLRYHIYVRESDVWSYGMLMSEIYNDGKVPFHGKSIAEIRKKIHDPEFRPFVPHLSNYPEIPIVSDCGRCTVE